MLFGLKHWRRMAARSTSLSARPWRLVEEGVRRGRAPAAGRLPPVAFFTSRRSRCRLQALIFLMRLERHDPTVAVGPLRPAASQAAQPMEQAARNPSRVQIRPVDRKPPVITSRRRAGRSMSRSGSPMVGSPSANACGACTWLTNHLPQRPSMITRPGVDCLHALTRAVNVSFRWVMTSAARNHCCV